MMRTVRVPSEGYLPQVEQALSDAGIRFRFTADADWVPVDPGDLHLDMSEARFLHVSGLVQLAIVALEAVPRSGGRIKVTMPRNDDARRFLTNAEFVPALRSCPYREAVRVEVDLESRGAGGYDQMFPLRWIDQGKVSQFHEWLEHVFSLSSNRSIGLITDDAESLSRLILNELVDNVVEHSGRSHALVAAWTQRQPMAVSSTQYLKSEVRGFVDARSPDLAATHLAIADAGCGIAHSLDVYGKKFEGPDLVAHAFDRWSSKSGDEYSNGTRGLYRVALLTNDHFGITTVRSGPHVATHLPSTFTSGKPVRENVDLTFPGTLLRVVIPMPTLRRAVAVPTSGRLEEIQPRMFAPSDVVSPDALRSALTTRRNRDAVMVVDLADSGVTREETQDLLTRIAELSHPGLAAVLGIEIENLDLRAASEGVRHQRHDDETALEAIQAVLCVGSNFDESWWAPQGRGVEDGSLVVAEADRDAAFPANIVRQGGTAHMRLTARGLSASTEAHLGSRIREYVRTPGRGKHYLTSTLRAVSGWIDLERMHADHPEEVGLIATLLVSKLRTAVPALLADRPNLVYEWGVDEEIARRVARGLNGGRAPTPSHSQRLRQRDMDAQSALGLPTSRPIVILVQAVSAGQSASRLVSHAIRQGYRVGGVLAIADTRAVSGEIELWSQKYPVLAAATIPLDVDRPLGRPYLVETNRTPPLPLPKHYCSTAELVKHLATSRAISVGHFSGSRDRHFTFYIDPQRLLTDGEFHDRLLRWFDAETAELDDASETIVVAIDEDGDRPAFSIASEIAARYGRRRAVKLGSFTTKHLGADPDGTCHLLVAWGAMTASSLFDAIDRLANKGVRNLVLLVVLDQLPSELVRHFDSLRSVSGRDDDMEVRVAFFARAPVSAYPQHSCPMCAQAASERSHAHEFPLPTEFRRQRDRLALQPWKSRTLHDAADPLGAQYDKESDQIVADALTRRIELTAAAESPRTAAAWVRALDRTGSNVDFLLSLSTLIAYEPDWLSKSPLSTTPARERFAADLVALLLPGQSVMRDLSENVRALIALRLVSKTVFVHELPELIRAFADRPEFDIICHLTATIYTRTHLRGSGLLRRMEESLAKALSRCVSDRNSQETFATLETLLQETRDRSAGSVDDINTVSLSIRMRNAVREFSYHSLVSAFDTTSVTMHGTDPHPHHEAWSGLHRQIVTRLQPAMPELRDRYLLTRQFHNNDKVLNTFFPAGGGPGRTQQVVELLEAVVLRDDSLTQDELAFLDSARAEYAELFNRPNAVELSMLEIATDELTASVGGILDQLEDKAHHYRETIRITSDLEFDIELDDIALPAQWLSDLLDAVLENTHQRIADPNVRAEVDFSAHMTLDPDPDSRLLTFTIRGVRVSDQPRTKSEPGHLDRLKSQAPRGVVLLEPVRDDATNTFELSIVIAGLRRHD